MFPLPLRKLTGMKKIFLIATLFFSSVCFAQEKQHKIVFDFTKNDTTNVATIMRQLRNIKKTAPNSEVEVVCYGPGLDMLMKDKSAMQKDIEEPL
jgi:hypothetical protein